MRTSLITVSLNLDVITSVVHFSLTPEPCFCRWTSHIPSPSAEHQATTDRQLHVRRHQFNEQLRWPLSYYHPLRVERYKRKTSHPLPMLCFTCIFNYVCIGYVCLFVSLNPGALTTRSSAAGIAVISTDTCWWRSSAWLIDFFLYLEKCLNFWDSVFMGAF